MRRMLRQYAAVIITSILSLFLLGAEPMGLARLTLINKSGMEIAVQLKSITTPCLTKNETPQSRFYYLPVPEGSKEVPSVKEYTIERHTYTMQVFYIETYDPVYGFHCFQPLPNAILMRRDMKVIIGKCSALPPNAGEPLMRKYLPYALPKDTPFVSSYWIYRYIY